MKTFPIGGVHPSENKLSGAKPIEVLPLPDVVTIPLAQHIGAPAVAKVAKGDKVVTGQLIAEAGSFMSANIHAPVSGTVTAVDMVPNGQGLRQMMITIKREGDDWAEGIDRSETIVRECTLSAQEIVARIKDAGIVGMGGATFPTHVKLSIPPGKKAESLIINGVECEPYLTSDHRTMLEHGEELLVGVTILMKAIAVEKAYIGIENNKPDAIAHLRRLAQGYKGIEVVPLKVKYPQGGEKQLIVAITGREVPPPPALPIDVGAVVCNASTTYAVYQAVQKHKPLIERVVTITGKGVREPKNLLTRMGTPVEALIEAVDHPNFGALVDMGNFMCADEAPEKAVGVMAPLAFHVHAKDFLYKPCTARNPGKGWFGTRGGACLRGPVIGHGVVPVEACLRILKNAGYDGTVAIEFEGMEPGEEAIALSRENLAALMQL